MGVQVDEGVGVLVVQLVMVTGIQLIWDWARVCWTVWDPYEAEHEA